MHCLLSSVTVFWCHQALAHSVVIFCSFHLTIMSHSIFLWARWATNKGAIPHCKPKHCRAFPANPCASLYGIAVHRTTIRWCTSIATNSIFLRYVKVAQQEKLKASLALFAIALGAGRDQQQKKPPATQQWSTFSLAYCVLDGFLQSNYFRKILSLLSERREIFCNSQGTQKIYNHRSKRMASQ